MADVELNMNRFFVYKEIFVQDGTTQVRYNICHPSGTELMTCSRDEIINLIKDLQLLVEMPTEDFSAKVDKLIKLKETIKERKYNG